MQLLTLDETTLFYYSLRHSYANPKASDEGFRAVVNNWSAAVNLTKLPAPANTTGSKTESTLAPGKSATASTISNSVAIESKVKLASTEKGKAKKSAVKVEEIEDDIHGIVDEDEMDGVEREDAMMSPVKGVGNRPDIAVRLI